MVSKEEVPEFQGDVECPVHDCDQTGSQIYVKSHFATNHARYEQRYAIASFFNDEDLVKQYADVDRKENVSLWDSLNERHQSAVENHPIFDVELVSIYFGSPAEANMYADREKPAEYNPDCISKKTVIRNRYDRKKRVVQKSHDVYGSNWGEVRWSIYQRDDFQCRLCDATPVVTSTTDGLDVHHITPASEFDSRAEMNDPSNLITLCKSCHGKHEGEHPDATQDEWPDLVKEEEQLVQ